MEQTNFKYEVLLIINKKKESTLFNLCDDKKNFLKILEKEGIKNHNNNKLEFKENKYIYDLKTALIQDKEERYFHLEIKHESEEELKNYVNFLKKLKTIFNEHNFYIEILRDDLYLYYSEKAYILINKVENHMRKFIKYFLITKVGIDWIKETTSKEIEKSINDYQNRDIEDQLNRLDFNQLGYFLFNEYSKKDISVLQKQINEKKEINDELLKEFIQISNWEKYFKQNIKCENDYLKSRWEKLYKLRNDVAHNKNFTEEKLNDVTKLYNEINEKLEEAFKNIDNIKTINKEEILNNLESVDSSMSFLEKAIALTEQNRYQENKILTDNLVRIFDNNKDVYETITKIHSNKAFVDAIAKTSDVYETIVKIHSNKAFVDAIAKTSDVYETIAKIHSNEAFLDKDMLDKKNNL
ncbi:HEPN domain-containing protein [Aliarcobacter butzleri]|uniref:HEPN domain-containing protein n=1 Tax=Aliarcobacter butzleri TaxID=28197 RepID=UPI0021B3283A|nr:HEPN domain-containing protein [Aliarcobacter butzleri]MCT7610684.1 HEPN domain-containing protein [Aliarcobacter butzleri]